jgi:hypothetical protein
MNITPKKLAITIGAMTPLGYISAGIMDSSVSYLLLLCAIISGLNIAKRMILEPRNTTVKTIKFKLGPALIFALTVVAWLDSSRIPLLLIWAAIFVAMHVLFVASSTRNVNSGCSNEQEAQQAAS